VKLNFFHSSLKVKFCAVFIEYDKPSLVGYKEAMTRVGIGYDVHPFADGRRLVLGGVEIPHAKGLQGHSDADVLLHAICDALLGAAGMRDIGFHFPDTDEAYRGADSKVLLKRTCEIIATKGWSIINLDSTLCLQRPKIKPHVEAMTQLIAEICGIEEDRVSIKATTGEHMGFVGREEGVNAYAVALIRRG
jgi:2-C-methyl-D-erythritol 2,4-cyclodiphosphate synthase